VVFLSLQANTGIIIIIMSIVPLGTYVVYKSSLAFSAPGEKLDITPAVLPTFVQCSTSPRISWPTPSSCTLWIPLQSCLTWFTIIFTECMSNPAKFALSYLLIDVEYLDSTFKLGHYRFLPNSNSSSSFTYHPIVDVIWSGY
jgi:hypothetical protein